MRKCSNPAVSPAFARLLRYVTDSAEISSAQSSVTWETSVRHRSQVQHRMTQSEAERLKQGYCDGSTVNDLAARFQLHRTTVMAQLERSGVPRRGKGPDEDQLNRAIELYERGQSTAKIGSLLGFSSETIRQRLLDAGVSLRRGHVGRT